MKKPKLAQSLHAQIRIYIKRTFKTQQEAADYFGVTQATISQVVNGKRTPSAAILEASGLL